MENYLCYVDLILSMTLCVMVWRLRREMLSSKTGTRKYIDQSYETIWKVLEQRLEIMERKLEKVMEIKSTFEG